nr:alpha/beta hydrolase [Rhabdothermincola salaria]
MAHGLGGDQSHWAAVAEHLADRHQVITFDIAGSGRSDPALFSPVRHASIVGFADDLAQLCAELELRNAFYVGHSMSGMAGALASAADPGLFDRMVLLGASARYVDDPTTGYVGGFTQEAIEQLLGAIASDFTLWSAGFASHVMAQPDRPDLGTEFARSLARYQPDVALTVFRAAFLSDFRAEMSLLSTPTLVLNGVADPAVPTKAARWLADAVADGHFAEIDVEGHFPHVVDPASVIAPIDVFLGP